MSTVGSDENPVRSYSLLFWIAGVSLAPLLFFFDLRQLEGLHLTESHLVVGRDFFNVWTGGNLAIENNLKILYDYHAYMAWQHEHFGPLDPYNYSYPPFSLFLAIPFGVLSYPIALFLWTILGAAFFYWAARPYMPSNLHPILAIFTPAALVNIWCGHYGFLMGGLWLLFFSSFGQRQVRSGLVAGLMTIKPHLGLLIAVVMVLRRKYGAVAVAACTAALLVALSGLAFGFDLWRQWILETSALQTKIMTAPGEKFYYLMMPSTYIALRDMPFHMGFYAQILVAVVALALFWRARHADPRDLAFIAATTTALVSPYIFNYDMTVVSLGFAIFVYSRWANIGRWERLILWLAFASPLFVMANNMIAPLALLAGLSVQVRLVRLRQSDKGEPGLDPMNVRPRMRVTA